MTQTPAAGWFVDPEDATQFRYWDGTAWTEHRSPRGPTTTDQLNQAGTDLADGLARGFTAVGTWVNQNTAVAPTPGQPTFASVAASCRDEPARQPLSVNTQLVLAPTDLAGIAQVFAQTQHGGDAGGRDPRQRALPAGPEPVEPGRSQRRGGLRRRDDGRPAAGRPRGGVLPAAGAARQQGLLATGVADLWAQGPGAVSAARVTVQLPEVAVLA